MIELGNKIFTKINIQDEQNRLTNIMNYFLEEERRNEFIKLYKETERIYEILSPDPFLRDYIKDYKLLVQIHEVIRNAFPEERKRLRGTLRKTEQLIKEEVKLKSIIDSLPVYEINKNIANFIKANKIPEGVKVVNLHRSLVSHISRNVREQPHLLSISEEVEKIITKLKVKQISIENALQQLTKLAEQIAALEEEQQKSGLSREEFSIFWIFRNYEVSKPETIAKEIYKELEDHREWLYNEKIERALRKILYKHLFKKFQKNNL